MTATSHADRYVLVADVGGTNTRIALAALGQSVASFTERARIADVDGLRALVERSAAEIGGVHKIHHCVFGFAGPVAARKQACIVNWLDAPVITTAEVADWMAPATRCTFVNDMEMTALGVLFNSSRDTFCALSSAEQPGDPAGTRLVIAPGTGLGSVAIIGGTETNTLARLQPSEFGHATASARTPFQRQVVAYLAERDGWAPSWEELVSGRGLENLYAAICHLRAHESQGDARTITSTLADGAAAIAAAAEQADRVAVTAIRLFYEFLGQFAQSLAFVVNPTGGIYLAGDNTRKNLWYLRTEFNLSAWLREHPTRNDLLSQYPLYMVDQDVNLAGCLTWLQAEAKGQS